MTPIRLLRADELAELGITPRALTTALTSSALVKVRPAVYATGAEWISATPEAQIIARARALALVAAVPPIISHESAAALHGLGLYRPDRARVHVIAPAERPGAAAGVIRHRGELPDEDLVELGAIRVTSLARTVADVARTGTFEQAVTVADAALRQQFARRQDQYDDEGAEEFRRLVSRIVRRSAHGQSCAKRVLDFADGRAQLPGESVSRVRLAALGFRNIALQVAVPGLRRRTYYVDFGMEDAQAFGEFDGSIKYVDGRILDGRTAAQVFDEEKQREDWIRGTTQRRYARWGWPHIGTARDLGTRLEAFGISAPGRP